MDRMTLIKTLSVTTPLLALGMVLPALAATAVATGTSALTSEQQAALTKVQELEEQAHQIAKDAGLPMRGEPGHFMSEEDRKKHDAIEAAIEDGDYATFAGLVEGTPFSEAITDEAAFDKLVEAHTLREDGDMEGAKAIFDELGLQKPMGGMHGGGITHFLTALSADDREEIRNALDLLDDGDTDGASAILEGITPFKAQ